MHGRMVYYASVIALCFCASFSTQEESSRWCAGLLFDADKYTCCSGTIHHNPHQTCCGKSAYNVLESSCCLNEITFGLSQTVSKCCGSKAYNPLNQICCGGHVLIRKSAQTKCCGSELYEERTHLCCGPKLQKMLQPKKTSHDLCCGTETYNPIKQCCCYKPRLQVISMDPNKTMCCLNNALLKVADPTSLHIQHQAGRSEQSLHESLTADPKGATQGRKTSVLPHINGQHCGFQKYDPHNATCCAGKLFPNNFGQTQCCGAEPYEVSEEGVLCCDGQLYHDQPAGSMCAGNVPYSPHDYTVCQKQVHLPAGQQCCGNKPFEPRVEICCNGHRHERSAADMACCGSSAYSASAGRHKCCTGQLYNLSYQINKKEAVCCGPLLLTDVRNQQCCHSAEKTLIYKTQPGHSCCGHWYYDMSLWSCCAGRLIPRPTNSSAGTKAGPEGAFGGSYVCFNSINGGQSFYLPPDFILRPLTDFNLSAICTMTVMLGTVESSAVKGNQRFVVLKNALKIQGKKSIVTAQENSFLVGPLEHCNTPALEQDRTYLWRKNSGHQYMPISDVPDSTAILNTIMTVCQSMTRRFVPPKNLTIKKVGFV